MDRMVCFHPTQTKTPPANRQNLSHCVELKDYGNPDYLHSKWKASSNAGTWASGGSDVGKSESRSVMERIRVQNLPGLKWSRHPTGAEITGEILEKIKSERCG